MTRPKTSDTPLPPTPPPSHDKKMLIPVSQTYQISDIIILFTAYADYLVGESDHAREVHRNVNRLINS